MFKVELENYGKLRVYFQHFRPDQWIMAGTNCIIEQDEKDNPEKIAVGVTTLYYKDRFEKEKGRRYSLTKAIQDFTRAERRQFWNAYWESKGG